MRGSSHIVTPAEAGSGQVPDRTHQWKLARIPAFAGMTL